MVRNGVILLLAVCGFSAFGEDGRSPINRDLPNWLSLGFESRYRSEGNRGLNFVDGADQDFLLQRLRFSVGVRPAHWIQFFGEAQDSRAFHIPKNAANTRDTLDLRQAYVDIGDEQGFWDLKAGRQAMAFGSERLIGASDWTNVARVFDGVRLGIHHGKDRVDLFATSVVNADPDNWDHHTEGNNLFGAYASLGSLIPGSKVEPYYLYRVSHVFAGEVGQTGHYDSSTYGARAAGAVAKVWTYETELVGQSGAIGAAPLRAWAFEGQLNRQLGHFRWKPNAGVEYNYASGDKRRGDNQVNTFDQLYPTNHSKYGLVDQQGRRNAENVRLMFRLKPRSWLMVGADETWLYLASRNDALYAAGGGVLVAPVAGGARYTDVGREWNLMTEVTKSRYFTFGGQGGILSPGQFLRAYSPGAHRGFYAFYLNARI
jgi:hypothetical protein